MSKNYTVIRYPYLIICLLYAFSFQSILASLVSNVSSQSAQLNKDMPIEELFLYADQCAQKIDKEKKEAILVIGPTRSGKSTLICDLMGVPWKSVPVENNDQLGNRKRVKQTKLVQKQKHVDFDLPHVGDNQFESHTLRPQGYTSPHTPYFYIDTPGILDSRGQEEANFCLYFFHSFWGTGLKKRILKLFSLLVLLKIFQMLPLVIAFETLPKK